MFALLFAGCWPYIPGTWEDYDVPDTSIVIGGVSWYDVLGEYWAEPGDEGSAYWGMLENATSTHTASELDFIVDGCTTDDADTDWFFDGLQPLKSRKSTLSGDPELELEWVKASKVMYADLSEGDPPAGTYSLESFDTEAGSYSAIDALIMPAPVDFDMEIFDTEEAPEIPAADLKNVTWDPRDDAELFVNGQISIVRGSQITEQLRCGTRMSAGELELDVDMLDGYADADYVLFSVGVFRETVVRLEGSVHSARFVGSRLQLGGAYLK